MTKHSDPAAKSVLVLLGGNSAERAVSLKTGAAVFQAVQNLGYQARQYDFRGDIADLMNALSGVDVMFNALHGTLGEDGRIQSIGDLMGVPYTHSGVLGSSVAMHKQMALDVYRAHGLPVADSVCLASSEIASLEDFPISLPLVAKPVAEGSSIGVRIFDRLHTFSDHQAELVALAQQQPLLFEAFVDGQELTVSVLERGGVLEALAVTELEVNQTFYDYQAKYDAIGGAVHHCPANITFSLENTLKNIALKAHQILSLRGVSRSDFRYDPKTEHLVILETNTQPGMTETSLLPEQAAHAGIDFDCLIECLIQSARCDPAPSETDHGQF